MKQYSETDAKKVGGGKLSPGGSVTDRDLAALVSRYKRTIASRHRALLGEEIEDALSDQEMWVSRKIDGEQWCMVVGAKKDVFLANPNGRVLSGKVPLLVEAKKALAKVKEGTVIAGELHVELEGRARHGDLATALAQGEAESLRFSPFDVAFTPEQEVLLPYQERLELLTSWFGKGKTVKVVETEAVSTVAEVREAFERWTEAGHEGAVVRTAIGQSYKVKPATTLDAVVCGYTVREDPTQVSSILLGLVREDGTIIMLSHCGNIGDEAARRTLRKQLEQMHVESNYSEANSRGAMYQFIRPELVAEVRVTDIQPTGRGGEPPRKMVLTYEEDKWTALRPIAGVSVLHPRLLRFREDKQFREEDVSLRQITERVYVPEAQTHIDSADLPESEILRRQVFTKVTKGKTAVRKLLVWKTNKSEEDSAFSPFVVHFTDYSPGRKDPLKRTVRLAVSAERAEALADDWLKSEIKRGWNEATAE